MPTSCTSAIMHQCPTPMHNSLCALDIRKTKRKASARIEPQRTHLQCTYIISCLLHQCEALKAYCPFRDREQTRTHEKQNIKGRYIIHKIIQTTELTNTQGFQGSISLLPTLKISSTLRLLSCINKIISHHFNGHRQMRLCRMSSIVQVPGNSSIAKLTLTHQKC